MYKFLKTLVNLAILVFYRKITINNRERTLSNGPLIIAANHPNTLMDPLLISAFLKQRVGFVAKATLFSNGFLKWFFKQLHMIPIRRAVDGDDPTAQAENKKAFQKCYEYLTNKGTILIFPEGNSFHEMKLRPLKTGAARIALEFEALNNFEKGTKILPIALNYSEPALFKKDIILNFGEAINISDYKELYISNPKDAVKQLTEDLKIRLESIIILTEHIEQEILYKQIHDLYKKRLEIRLKEEGEDISDFSIAKEIANAIVYHEANHPEKYQLIKTKIDKFSSLIKKLKVHTNIIEKNKTFKVTLIRKIITPFYLIIGFPLYVFGLITNYIPYIIPSKVVKLITDEMEYKASIMMVTGLFIFPLIYFGEIYFVNNYTNLSFWYLILFSILLPVSGFYTLHYYNFIGEVKSLFFINTFLKENEKIHSTLINSREEISILLDTTSKEYRAYLTKQKQII